MIDMFKSEELLESGISSLHYFIYYIINTPTYLLSRIDKEIVDC